MRRKLGAVAGIVLGAVVVLGGCSGGGEESGTGTEAPQGNSRAGGAAGPGAEKAPAGVATDGKTQADGRTGAGSGQGQPSLTRQIVRTGSITLESREIEKHRQDAIGVVTGLRGHVASEDTGSDADGELNRATLVLRVPTASFETAIQRLSGIAKRTRIQQDSTDVTEQVVDVESRIASQRASLNRMRTLLARANTVAEVVSVESELTRREADLEALLAKQKSLSQQTELATLTLQLTEPGKTPPEEESDRGFLAGLRGGWTAFVTSVTAVATALGAALPFLVLLTLIAVPLYRFRHRLRRTSRSAPASPAPEQA